MSREESFQERVGRNQATYREVNEAIELDQEPADESSVVRFVCECARTDCRSIVELTPAEYEAIRANPRRFVIVDGHELPEVERVVERHERYAVAEKVDRASRVAEETDPRG